MAQYRVLQNCTGTDGIHYKAGAVISFAGEPSRHFEPLDDEAKASASAARQARQARRAEMKLKGRKRQRHPDDPEVAAETKEAAPAAKGKAAA